LKNLSNHERITQELIQELWHNSLPNNGTHEKEKARMKTDMDKEGEMEKTTPP